MAGDAYFSAVSLLLHGDGVDASTTIVDSSSAAHTLAVYGANASIKTAQSKFGGSSIRTSSGGVYVTGTDTSMHMGADDFTIELFLFPDSTAAGAIINNYGGSNAASGFVIQSNGSGVLAANFYSGSSVTIATSASGVLTSGEWQHLAVVRYGATLTMYRNGLSVASASVSGKTMNSPSAPTRCGMESDTGAYPLSAYFDEVRITKGVARYTAGFTPPTEAFPDTPPTYALSGVTRNASGDPAARVVAAFKESTKAFVGTATSDGTTGAYSIDIIDDSAHTLVAYPADGEALPALVLRGVIPLEI